MVASNPVRSPFDLTLTVGATVYLLKLARDENGRPAWARSSQQHQPVWERTVGGFAGGAGAADYEPGCYSFADGVDTSRGYAIRGPAVVATTKSGGGALDGVVKCLCFHHDKLWIGAGQKVYRWNYTNNNWEEPAVQPATTQVITDMISILNYLMVVFDNGVVWKTSADDGASWVTSTTHGVPVAVREGKHLAVTQHRTTRPVLWMAVDPDLIYSTEDPTDTTLWDAGTRIGQGGSNNADHFTGLSTDPNGGGLLIGKELGWYDLDVLGNGRIIYGPVKADNGVGLENFAWPASVNGRRYVQSQEYDVVEYSQGNVQGSLGPTFRENADGSLTRVPEMQRAIKALAGDNVKWLYAGLSGSEGYVMRGSRQGGRWIWHGSVMKIGEAITNRMWYGSHPLGADVNDYLWVFPTASPFLPYRALIPLDDPENNASVVVTTTAGWLRLGYEDAEQPEILKILSQSIPVSRGLSATATLQLEQRMDATAGFTTIGAAYTESPVPSNLNTTYWAAGTSGRRIELRVAFAGASGKAILARLWTRYYPRPPRLDVINCTVLAETGARSQSGARGNASAQGVATALIAAKDATTPPTLTRPYDGATWTVGIQSMQETWISQGGGAEPGAALALAYELSMMELPTVTVPA